MQSRVCHTARRHAAARTCRARLLSSGARRTRNSLLPTLAVTSPPALPYGPRTPRVRHFLQRLARQPAIGWLSAARAYADRRDTPAVRRADRALGQAIDMHDRARERDALVGPVLQMARSAVPAAAGEGDDGDMLERLAEPALAAALALLVEDLLSAEHVAALYAPFAHAIPLDALPALDEEGSAPAP